MGLRISFNKSSATLQSRRHDRKVVVYNVGLVIGVCSTSVIFICYFFALILFLHMRGASFSQPQLLVVPLPTPQPQRRMSPPKTEVVHRYSVGPPLKCVIRPKRYLTIEEVEKPLKDRYLALHRELVELRVNRPKP